MKRQLKTALMKKLLDAKKKKAPFHEKLAELYRLPSAAPDDFNNSYYFSGHSLAGESLFMRLGLRGDGTREVWFVYKNGGALYCNTVTEYTAAEDVPLVVSCEESGKRWAVAYDGPMADQRAPEQTLRGVFHGTFTATDPIFDFTYHMNSLSTAAAMAREKWSKALFAELRENSQTHYEQNGRISGGLELGGQPIAIDLRAVRDHSFGKRDWNYMNRHIWLMAVLENGDMINVSMVSYPAMRRLDAGNVIFGGKTISLTEIAFQEDMVCGGAGPTEFHLACKLENGTTMTVYAKKETEVVYTMGGGYTLREGIGSFTIDGRKARGILEFGFHQDSGRW